VIAGSDDTLRPALAILCAGAAKGLVTAVRPELLAATGVEVDATFGAVGAMRQKLLAGAPCDVMILTRAQVDALETEGRVEPGTDVPLGRVQTGVAVRAGDRVPSIGDEGSLRAALVEASAILFPDRQRSTAGIHFVEVLNRLGIYGVVAARLAEFPNGAAAMQALAASTERNPIGCTQVTEISDTPGVALAGPLPSGFGLSTVYAAAVSAGARAPDAARTFVELISGPASRDLRERCGFEG
jgi:molybdate transport system substrate-binding protein